mmetsp:Transcript_109600/g.353790  ORF Transcript_109600/g.353790 Transcript_109600/m.353790 type:complete len:343 (+) Transcript_109600:374-1402(+)
MVILISSSIWRMLRARPLFPASDFISAQIRTPRKKWTAGRMAELPLQKIQQAVSSQVRSWALLCEMKGSRRRIITDSVRLSFCSKYASKKSQNLLSHEDSATMLPTTPRSVWLRMATWPARIAATTSRASSWRRMWMPLYHSSSGLARKRKTTCSFRGGGPRRCFSSACASSPLSPSGSAGLDTSDFTFQLHSTSSVKSSRGGRPTERATTCSGRSMKRGGFLRPRQPMQPAARWPSVTMRCSRATSGRPSSSASSCSTARFFRWASTWALKGPSAATSAGIRAARSQSAHMAPRSSGGRPWAQAPSWGLVNGSRDRNPRLPSTLQKSWLERSTTSGTCRGG